MKKGFAHIIGFFILCSFLLTSCSGPLQNRPSVVTEDQWVSADIFSLKGTCSEKGYYYLENDYFLCFFDESTKKKTVLCAKAGCKHQDDSCYAYTIALPSFIFFSNGKLYTIEVSDEGCKLIQWDEDGSNREEKLRLMNDIAIENSSITIVDYKVCKNCLYYQGNVLTETMDGELSQKVSLRRVNLDTFQEEEIYSPDKNGCSIVSVQPNKMIFHEFDAPEQTENEYDPEVYNSEEFLTKNTMKIQIWEEKDHSIRTLLETNRWETLGAICAEEDFLYILNWDEGHQKNGVQSLNLNTMEMREVMEPKKAIDNFYKLGNYVMFYIDQRWTSYSIPDFKETNCTIFSDGYQIEQGTQNGYIVTKVLEKVSEGGFDRITKQGYYYISREDMEKGEPNYTEFYVRSYD